MRSVRVRQAATARRICTVGAAIGALTLTLPSIAHAAPGDLDPTFGGTGWVYTSTPNSDEANAVVVQADGKVVLAGTNEVIRYNENGSVDTTFDGDGRVFLAAVSATDVALQPDGKLVVLGTDWTLARLHPNGSLDTTFDGDGLASVGFGGSASRVVVQSGGKIVVGGSAPSSYCSDTAVARLNTDGSLDTSFDGDGRTTIDYFDGCDGAADVAVQMDGKILTVGSIGTGFSPTDVAVTRFNVNGSLDATFDGDGRAIAGGGSTSEFAHALTLQPDGKIVTAGSLGNDILLVRFDPDGTLDASFDADGMATGGYPGYPNVALGVAVQADGRIVTGGGMSLGPYPLWLEGARFNADGSPDTTFGGTGVVLVYFLGAYHRGNDLALAPDGRIVIGGGGYYDDNGTWTMIAVRMDPGPVTPPDTDGDGVLNAVDNCPLLANPDQANSDGDSEGDVCDTDDDNDGVLDVDDPYPASNLEPTVVIGSCDSFVPNGLLPDGSTFNDLIAQCAIDNPSNHGQFVKCVSHLTNEWKKQGLITGAQKGAIMSCTS